MKRISLLLVLFSAVLLFSNCLVIATASKSSRDSGPTAVAVSNPELIVIPGTYVYWYGSPDGDLYYYGGFWWRLGGKIWYRAEVYSGPWIVIDIRYIPSAVTQLPPDWRHRHSDAPRVRYDDAKNHWHEWERDKYWEKRKWKHEEPRGRK